MSFNFDARIKRLEQLCAKLNEERRTYDKGPDAFLGRAGMDYGGELLGVIQGLARMIAILECGKEGKDPPMCWSATFEHSSVGKNEKAPLPGNHSGAEGD